jgi:hypothetical protein
VDEHLHKGTLKEFIRMVYLISPIIIIILLFVAFHLNMLICISTGLAVAILNTMVGRKFGAPAEAGPWRQRRQKITGILKIIFVKLSVYQMVFVVISVLIFTGIMRASTLIPELSGFFSPASRQAGAVDIPFVYMTITIIFLPFIIGLLTGLTVGFVGITFPLIFSTIVPVGVDVMPMAVLAYVSGVTGVMLSPVHLCLVLTNQYYGSSFRKVYKYLIPVSLLVLGIAIIGFCLYMYSK